MSKTKFFGIITILASILLLSPSAQAASDAETIQPAVPAEAVKVGNLGRYFEEYSSYLQLNTALHSSETMHIPDIHIGGTDGTTGGVTFFNGTIINASDGDFPVTFGDDVRIDGMIWRDQKGTASDNRPVLFGDSVSPALDGVNLLGDSDRRWQYLYVSDNIYGDDVINEDNLAVTNSASTNQLLAYAGDNNFKWTDDIMGSLSSSASDGEIVVREGDSWTTSEVSEVINNSVTEGDTVIDDILSGLDCEDGEIIIYDTDTASWLCNPIGEAAGGIAVGIDGSDGADGADGADGHSILSDIRLEQGRINVAAGTVTTCQTNGYTNLGHEEFTPAFSDESDVIITATYGAEVGSEPSGFYPHVSQHITPLPIEIIRTTVGDTLTRIDIYGCPPVAGYIYWRAVGE